MAKNDGRLPGDLQLQFDHLHRLWLDRNALVLLQHQIQETKMVFDQLGLKNAPTSLDAAISDIQNAIGWVDTELVPVQRMKVIVVTNDYCLED